MRRLSNLQFLAALLAACFLLTMWSQRARSQGRVALPNGVALGLLRPAQISFSSVGGWCGDVARVMFRRGDIARENAALKAQVADLENSNQRLRRYLAENRELRDLLKMPALPGGKILAAEVISRDATSYARRVVINAGARQGVAQGDAVFGAAGAVGQVIESDGKFCTATVLLITDRMSGVGAMVARNAARGLLRGDGGDGCVMDYLDVHADVREGDLIVASGDSRVFPKGAVLGRVRKVVKDKTYSQSSAVVEPSVDFEATSAVRVLLGGR